MTFDDEIKRLRKEGITYLQVEIGTDGKPFDIIISGETAGNYGRGVTLDDAIRDARDNCVRVARAAGSR